MPKDGVFLRLKNLPPDVTTERIFKNIYDVRFQTLTFGSDSDSEYDSESD